MIDCYQQKKDPILEGFEFGNAIQDIYNRLSSQTKLEIQQRTNITKKDFGVGVGLLGGIICLFSNNSEDRKFGERALGFSTSLLLRS